MAHIFMNWLEFWYISSIYCHLYNACGNILD